MLRTIVRLSLPFLLSACGTTAQVHETSFYGFGPTSAYRPVYQAPPGLSDQHLLNPRYYMDDDATPRWWQMSEPNMR